MNYLKCIKDERIMELRLYVLGPDTYHIDEFSVKELSNNVQISIIKKLLIIDEKKRPNWLRFIKRYILYYPISDDAIDILFENIHHPISLDLLTKIITSQGYNETQGKSLCIAMLHCNDLDIILALSKLIYLHGQMFSPTIYRLLDNLDRRLMKLGHIDIDVFAKNYLNTAGQSMHLFKVS